MRRLKVVIFGATGSIGQQTIKALEKNKFIISGISYFNNHRLADKIRCLYKFSPKYKSNIKSYQHLIDVSKPDIIVNAIYGSEGYDLTKIAILSKAKTILVANKEGICLKGWELMALAHKHKKDIFPIDSEHSSLFQIIKQYKCQPQKLFITTSGGPFWDKNNDLLAKVSYQQACQHPTWKMGEAISINSATLVNKALEVIEAYYYFNNKNIEVLLDTKANLHAVVLTNKNIYLAYSSKPCMYTHIQDTIYCFKKKSLNIKIVKKDMLEKYQLPFIPEPIKWAYEFLKTKNFIIGTIIVLANEIACNLFKQKKIKFSQICELIDRCIDKFKTINYRKIDTIDNLQKQLINFIQKNTNKNN